jgi:proline racemase
MRAELEGRWLRLTRADLPARARAERWPLRDDHCFQRVLLDAACGGRWYDAVAGRPAYRHLDEPRLAAAVALAERLAADPDAATLLRRLNADSLRWRGKG